MTSFNNKGLSGQWAVGSGQWAVGSGQWAVNFEGIFTKQIQIQEILSQRNRARESRRSTMLTVL
jgi:hypothetical protein